jgi:hypothetical protein|tara:strand:+ start:941 stop:3334 length:2394 start_codon:yes stop_codon:yes gene_type:complete
MIELDEKDYKLTGTKAETLLILSKLDYNVPSVYYFTVEDWNHGSDKIITTIINLFPKTLLAIRSSTKAEDTEDSSMAGAFESLLNVKSNNQSIMEAVAKVIESFDDDLSNQVLIQPMVTNVTMSGVVMTHVLDDGSPYHVVNYDDKSGLTDTVTSGTTINKTVYVYNGVDEKDFDSPYLLSVLNLIRSLQVTFTGIPLDIEFAIDKDSKVHLLQVRRITTINSWNGKINKEVSSRMVFLKQYVSQIMQPRPNLFGDRTLLGFMPDWNPAEMIGVVPHPLAMSLYRELITKSTWRIAREKMGYRKMPNVDLMISLFGRVYIDVRNSINSFLPEGLSDSISKKVVEAYIDRLDNNPYLHDKIEFEVVHTAYDFDFENKFNERYPELLSTEEFLVYKSLLRKLTQKAINDDYNSSINTALRDIKNLKELQKADTFKFNQNSFSIADKINTLIDECIEFGTLPFSILARHGFIAEGLLRSAVNNNVISEDRLKEFRQSIVTVAGEMSDDFKRVYNNDISKEAYLSKYGHLRPSSYDILSPNYSNRDDLFEGKAREGNHTSHKFKLSPEEQSSVNILLGTHALDGITADELFNYAEKAIKGREYGKFIFTKHLSSILEYATEWGEIKGFDRSDMSMLNINDILNILNAPLTNDVKLFYQEKINKAQKNYEIATSFKLSYLIRSVRDVHIVPMQRSFPNFIGNKRIEAEVIELTPHMAKIPSLENKIVCIEGADPGYDWIFTRAIAGLITKYGGANSHMAIRSAEYNLPAAIGCGEQPYERVLNAKKCLLDCQGKRLEPIDLT